jgi:hypothetical protein
MCLDAWSESRRSNAYERNATFYENASSDENKPGDPGSCLDLDSGLLSLVSLDVSGE